jgi:hypothetical protein
MNNQELRDKVGRLLGKIKHVSTGKFEGRDAAGQLKGTYGPKTDQTRDAVGRVVGKGNLLATLITSP